MLKFKLYHPELEYTENEEERDLVTIDEIIDDDAYKKTVVEMAAAEERARKKVTQDDREKKIKAVKDARNELAGENAVLVSDLDALLADALITFADNASKLIGRQAILIEDGQRIERAAKILGMDKGYPVSYNLPEDMARGARKLAASAYNISALRRQILTISNLRRS